MSTEGASRQKSGMPVNYVVDYVTEEQRAEDGGWDLKAVYSPEAWKLSQGFDYCRMIAQELARLKAKLDKEFSWETAREIDRVRKELQLTNRAWRFEPRELAGALHLQSLVIVNDFAAAAAGVDGLAADEVSTLNPAGEAVVGTRLVLGPGTGLGTAAIVSDDPPRIVSSEAGP